MRFSLISQTHVKRVPCHGDMARCQVAVGGDGLQTWKVAASMLNIVANIRQGGDPPDVVSDSLGIYSS
jgi:hypothetical protein